MVLTVVGWSDQASLLALRARGTLRMSGRKLGCRVRCSGLTLKMGVPAVAELGLSRKIIASWARYSVCKGAQPRQSPAVDIDQQAP
jgi:hypothetical protein